MELQNKTAQLLRRRQVETLTGLRRSTIYERISHGQFPRPIHLGPRTVAWLASEVDGWIAARIAESRPAATTEVKP
jgi:prophage regulatory protein